MDNIPLHVGDVVQINPDSDSVFGGCLMIITDPKPWGAQGAITAPNMQFGVAYYRCKFENMEYVGSAKWTVE